MTQKAPTKKSPKPQAPQRQEAPYRSVPIDSLSANPRNARRHPRKSIDALKNSLSRFGQQKPIVVAADGQIIAGHGTWTAARELGWTSIDVRVSQLAGAEAAAYGLADNAVAETSEWDGQLLSEELALPELGAMDLLGLDAAALEAIVLEGDDGKRNAEEKSQKPEAAGASPTGASPGKAIQLTAEQREGLDEVFAKFRAIHETPGGFPLLEGQILVLICADWMAGN